MENVSNKVPTRYNFLPEHNSYQEHPITPTREIAHISRSHFSKIHIVLKKYFFRFARNLKVL